MAYLSKEHKAKIVAAVKAVLPKDWKATFAIRNASGIVMTIKSTPLTLEQIFGKEACDAQGDYRRFDGVLGHVEVHHLGRLDRDIKDEGAREILEKVVAALNLDNYNNSDLMRDYHDVGHYVDLQFGHYKRPYAVKA